MFILAREGLIETLVRACVRAKWAFNVNDFEVTHHDVFLQIQ